MYYGVGRERQLCFSMFYRRLCFSAKSVPPMGYRPYSTDITHYVISLFSGYYLIGKFQAALISKIAVEPTTLLPLIF